jgi:stage II sporulation protein AA (anti-sigma F factor antagonist)
MIASPATGQLQDTEPTIEVTWPESDVALVVLAGEQDLGSAPVIEAAVGDALGRCSHLVIDLSAVQFVDSSIISLLVQTRREAADRGCDFNLVLQGAPSIERTFEICGVLQELNCVTTRDDAMARGRAT